MRLLRAHALWSPDAGLLPAHALVIREGRIEARGPSRRLLEQYPRAELIDLGDCLVLPGLVNAHTHLELSHLCDRVEYDGDFTGWVRELTKRRAPDRQALAGVLASGVRQSLAGGATLVGDIAHDGAAREVLVGQPLRKICFAEVVGLGDDVSSQYEALDGWLGSTSRDAWTRLGIAPHGPYSAGQRLYELSARFARDHGLALTTHLAEMPAEFEFLATGSGPWRRFLDEIGKPPDDFHPPGKTPVHHFLDLDLAGTRWLLAHVNYLDDAELARLARTKHSVAYCPRSHRFFGHEPHRFRDMLAAGINVCLGTDSLASNDSLSMLDELRFLHRDAPDVPAETLLAMATLNGARALGWDDRTGQLIPGRDADLLAVPVDPAAKDLRTALLESHAEPRLVMLAGEIVHEPANL